MADTPEFSGPPITINADDGSSKIYDTGLLSPEARQAVDMVAFINRLRQVLDTSSQVFSNVVTSNLTDEAMVDTTKATKEVVEDDTDTDETDTK